MQRVTHWFSTKVCARPKQQNKQLLMKTEVELSTSKCLLPPAKPLACELAKTTHLFPNTTQFSSTVNSPTAQRTQSQNQPRFRQWTWTEDKNDHDPLVPSSPAAYIHPDSPWWLSNNRVHRKQPINEADTRTRQAAVRTSRWTSRRTLSARAGGVEPVGRKAFCLGRWQVPLNLTVSGAESHHHRSFPHLRTARAPLSFPPLLPPITSRNCWKLLKLLVFLLVAVCWWGGVCVAFCHSVIDSAVQICTRWWWNN